uniref:Uncharacterized protein n=1 Tax=Anguilla anguilla TaxID=7936 RepID=A0A0E9X1A4_ANGAN
MSLLTNIQQFKRSIDLSTMGFSGQAFRQVKPLICVMGAMTVSRCPLVAGRDIANFRLHSKCM